MKISDLIKEVRQEQKVDQRSADHALVQGWKDLFGESAGRFLKRVGDTITITVEHSAEKMELEFKKQEMMETLKKHPEFSFVSKIHIKES